MKTLLLSISCLSFTILNAQQNSNFLDINNVKAKVMNIGDMHWDQSGTGNASYEVPKNSGKHSDFASCIWMGGYDDSNLLHTSAQTYRQNGVDFWAGPLDTINGATSLAVSNQYDKIWKLNRSDIDAFITNFNNGNVQNQSYTPVADLLSWPAQGAGIYTKKMAPFVDVNHNGVYDPLTGGDYPEIKGDQSLYFIFNDNLSSHQATGGLPMKVEIHATAYAYGNSSQTSQHAYLNNATFYNYKIINRSNEDYNNVYVSMWTDVDLGYYADDYIGCDVTNNFGYTYNGDSDDETAAGINGYGTNSPAAGYQILRGPLSNFDGIDNNHNGFIDEACEQQLMTRFTYFNNSTPGTPSQATDPDNAQQYYGFMSGFWKDGTPFTCGGNGYGGTVQTPYMFPGNSYSNSPCGSANWTESTAGNLPNDRRYIISTGPFTFQSGTSQEIEFVHCTSFPASNIDAITKLKSDMMSIKDYKDFHDPVTCVFNSVKETEYALDIRLYPNPATSSIVVSSNQKITTDVSVEIIDVVGKTQFTTQSKELSHLTIDISNFSSGIYFLKINADGKSTTKKFVKE